MNISITFDVEVWCGGWNDLDAKFPGAFQRYTYGDGGYALPYTLDILARHGLKAVFFVEPLFAYRFGFDHLGKIVDLIQSAGQEVQLHLHPEWADETVPPLVPNPPGKRPYLHQYSLAEQTTLIERASAALRACGAPRPSAFRAGGFACNRDTLRALAANGITVDSSVNPAYPGSGEDLGADRHGIQPRRIEGVMEYPVTVFHDGFGRSRHWQVGAVGVAESILLVRHAAARGHTHLVLVSHNFELLVPGKSRPDPLVTSRYGALCRWLAEHADRYPCVGFDATPPARPMPAPGPLKVSLPATLARYSSQLARRLL